MTLLALPSVHLPSVHRTVELERRWWSWAGPHGGHVAALLLEAVQALPGAGDRPVRALTASYLRAAPAGPARVEALEVRTGRSTTVADAVLLADGTPAVTARAVLGAARPDAPPSTPLADVLAPVVAPPEQLPVSALPAEMVPFAQQLEYRPADGRLPLLAGDRPQLLTWARFLDDRPLDAPALTVLVDALPPALYGLLTVPAAVPTVELGVTYGVTPDGAPPRGWVLLRIATRSAEDGWCVDDSEVWSRDGRLLAAGRQTRLVLGAA
jgi:acyl-CoA thioesterase